MDSQPTTTPNPNVPSENTQLFTYLLNLHVFCTSAPHLRSLGALEVLQLLLGVPRRHEEQPLPVLDVHGTALVPQEKHRNLHDTATTTHGRKLRVFLLIDTCVTSNAAKQVRQLVRRTAPFRDGCVSVVGTYIRDGCFPCPVHPPAPPAPPTCASFFWISGFVKAVMIPVAYNTHARYARST